MNLRTSTFDSWCLKNNSLRKFDGEELFKIPAEDDLHSVAVGEDGNKRKLNDNQLAQIWDKAEFTVPSINYPGQFHTWKLSSLIQVLAKLLHIYNKSP